MPGEKTEKASFKKHEDERKKGHVFQSPDLTSAAALLGIFGALKILGPSAETTLMNGMRGLLQDLDRTVSGPGDLQGFLGLAVQVVISVLLPVFAVSVIVAVGSTLAQTRFLISASQMAPKLERISPIQGFKKLFSVRTLVDMVKSILKMIAVFAVIVADVYPKLPVLLELFDVSLAGSVSYIGGLVVDVGLKTGAVLLVIGVADLFYQWWDFERGIRMSKQEVRDEFKETEGNPLIKNRIRGLQRRLARMRMMQAVQTADVVIRNPTHYAVALKYEAKSGRAPVVVAKGADEVALRIIAVAEEHHIHTTENRPLAQALYKSVEIGSEIPAEFYKAVAEVLAYIYALRRAGRT